MRDLVSIITMVFSARGHNLCSVDRGLLPCVLFIHMCLCLHEYMYMNSLT